MTQVTIIGGGIAGSYAALCLPEHIKVTIYLKDQKPECSSYLSQGGIAAAITNEDSPESHAQDTISASHNQADQKAVKILTEEGPQRIQELIDQGCPFDKDLKGELQIGHEGAHTHPRIVHAGGDATGKKVMEFLWHQILQKKNIEIKEHSTVFDIKKIPTENSIHKQDSDSSPSGRGWERAFQGKFFNTQTHTIHNFHSDFCIIATGGYGQVYAHATCPSTITGDGIYLAEKLGAESQDMAYVQFHPTAFTEKIPELGNRQFLISEAVRGEGGILKNENGDRFMKNIHPQEELAPRDIIARAIYHEIKDKQPHHVYLDISHKNPKYIKSRFPTIYQTCLKKGIDITTDPIPVRPSVHYCMGGIKTNLHGETDVNNLFAIGEVASTGIHGANRLASNSLLEALVFGHRAAAKITEKSPVGVGLVPTQKGNPKGLSLQKIPQISPEKYQKLELIQKEVRQLLWTYCSIIRNEKKLQEAQKILKDITEKFNLSLNQVETHPQVFQTQVIVHIAQEMIQDALQKKESIGAHYLEK